MPELVPDEVLVRNAVIGLNPVDWRVLGSSELGWRRGYIFGVDGAGTVIAQAIMSWSGIAPLRQAERLLNVMGVRSIMLALRVPVRL